MARKARNSSHSTQKTFAEFFAGIGLVHLGLEPGGWQCVYANDLEPKKRQMYEDEFGPTPYYHVEDIWNADAVAEAMTERPFLATASFPCIDLSLAGHWRGFGGEHSSTYFGFLEVVKRMEQHRPRMVMLENVYGFLTSRGGQDFRRAMVELAKLGYWLDAIVLDARWFVPQSRPRTFIFGFHKSLDSPLLIRQESKRFRLDDPWHEVIERTASVRPNGLRPMYDRINLPTGWATLDFPVPSQADYDLSDVLDLDAKQEWWSPADTDKHYDMMEPPSRSRVDELMNKNATAVGTAFRRTRRGKTRTEVRFDVAGCLRTPKGGSAKQIVVAIIKGKLRMRWMSAREYARLQGAGDFNINVPPIQAMYGFGDAVCVPAVKWIDQHILTPVFESATVTTPAKSSAVAV